MVGVRGLHVGKHDLGANQRDCNCTVMLCFFKLKKMKNMTSSE